MPENESTEGLRAMWSGVITFGLVSIPVDLHATTKPRAYHLRMLSSEGTPLARRYYCPEHEAFIERDEIVRGHEEEDESFLTVDEEELDALEPKRSREIDLKRFVPREQIAPLYLNRTYLLVPGGESNKAYRLLASTMATTGRAGIATFVMRGHSYLVAITSDEGLLRAQLLRYADEVRTPEDVGLAAPKKAEPKQVKAFVKAIEKASVKRLDASLFEDEEADAIFALAAKKEKAGAVVEVDEELASESAEGDVVDLMQLLKQRLLEGGDGKAPPARKSSTRQKSAARSAKKKSARANGGKKKVSQAQARTKEDLYEEAKELDIPGRSQMTKDQLARAIAKSA